MSIIKKGKPQKQKRTLTNEHKLKIAASHIGIHNTEATKQKISEIARHDFASGKRRHPVQNHRQRFMYNDISFRSSWEAGFAAILDENQILWQYEPRWFIVGEHGYLPDFYLPEYDKWIEIKGSYKGNSDVSKPMKLKQMGYDIEILMRIELREIGVFRKLRELYKIWRL